MKIVIADDAKFMRIILRKQLEEMGHQVIAEAATGKDAVLKYLKYKPDLITLDITMPLGDGISAAAMIKEEDPSAKIILITAIPTPQHRERALKLGVMGIIKKPVDTAQLRAMLDQIEADSKKTIR